MKVVKNAVIEIVGFGELMVGDYILWGNWKRRVIEIDRRELIVLVG